MSLDHKTRIEICDLSIGFSNSTKQLLPILRNIDLSIQVGETLGLIGESGSGKKTLALAMMGYLGNPLRVLTGSTSFHNQSAFVLSA